MCRTASPEKGIPFGHWSRRLLTVSLSHQSFEQGDRFAVRYNPAPSPKSRRWRDGGIASFCRRFQQLQAIQALVDTAIAGHECIVTALFGEAAVVQYDDMVGMADGR